MYSPRFRRIEPVLVCATVAGYGGCILTVAKGLRGIDDPVVLYAVAFIIVQAAIQVVLILGLVIGKHVRTLREVARERRMRAIEDLLATPERSAEALASATRWPEEFLAVAEGAMRTLSGTANNHVAGIIEASHLYPRLLSETIASDPTRAIRAITVLGRLEKPEARAAVKRSLTHSTEAVRRAARKAIVSGGDEQARREVLGSVCGLPFWQRIILFHLVPADSILEEFLKEALHSGVDEQILVALEFVLTRQRLMLFPVPVGLARSTNVEIRIKFLRALPFLHLEGGVNVVLEAGLHDPDWRVRALAARACGYLRAGAFVERLIEMCGTFEDPAEAGHAARALSAMGGEGWSRLQQVVATGTGLGSRIAVEVIEKRMVGGPEVPR
jgi:hypothetical protein